MLIRKDLPARKQPQRTILPDFIADRVADVNFHALRRHGITTCFIDLDDTVVHRGKFEIDDQTKAVLQSSGCTLYIATNRPKRRDLRNLRQDLGAAGVIHPAGIYAKPSPKYFLSALKQHNLQPHEVVMIGDRYVQDVYGPNSAGLWSLHITKLGPVRHMGDRMLSALEGRLTNFIGRLYDEI